MKDLFQWDKAANELRDFWAEVVVQDGPRLKDPKQWGHVYVDFWVSLFGMSYTLGHIVALGLPLLIIWLL